MEWLKTTEMYCLMVWGSRHRKPRSQQGHAASQGSGEELFLVSSSIRRLMVLLCLRPHHSILRLCLHRAFFSVCFSLSCPLLIRTPVTEFWVLPKSREISSQETEPSTKSCCIDFEVYILRFQEDVNFVEYYPIIIRSQ